MLPDAIGKSILRQDKTTDCPKPRINIGRHSVVKHNTNIKYYGINTIKARINHSYGYRYDIRSNSCTGFGRKNS